MPSLPISVIVPVYNAEEYLGACIESILAQTFKDFELLLINDASHDNSLAICENYAKQDARIRVFNHPTNQGESGARNTGIAHALGKYFVFIDADDRVLIHHLESLYVSPNLPSGTLVHAPHFKSNQDVMVANTEVEPFNIQNVFAHNLSHYTFLFAGPPWGKLLEAAIIHENAIRFRPEVKINGDHVFHLEYLMFITSYINVGIPSYVYINRPGSVSKRILSAKENYQRTELLFKLSDTVLTKFDVNNDKIINSFYFTPLHSLQALVISLYRVPYKLARNQRIKELKKITKDYEKYLSKYVLVNNLKFELIALILKFKNFRVMDLCLYSLFHLRYSILSKFMS